MPDRNDRENRKYACETIEKLCSVSEANFSEGAAVIEVFRKEGRTFFLPPPEVELNKIPWLILRPKASFANGSGLKKGFKKKANRHDLMPACRRRAPAGQTKWVRSDPN